MARATKPKASQITKRTVRAAIRDVGQRLEKTSAARDGEIAFRLAGTGGGEYWLQRSDGKVELSEALLGENKLQPAIEIIGKAGTVQRILSGEVDAREEFLKGSLRIRGDLRYLSDISLELGFLDEPL